MLSQKLLAIARQFLLPTTTMYSPYYSTILSPLFLIPLYNREIATYAAQSSTWLNVFLVLFFPHRKAHAFSSVGKLRLPPKREGTKERARNVNNYREKRTGGRGG